MEKFRASKWFIPAIIAVVAVLLGVAGILAFAGKSVPATGTIQITTTTPPAVEDFTLSTPVAFGSTSFAVGAPITITGTVTVSNTGNVVINSLAVACSNLPAWITGVAITQTPIPVNGSQLETVTLTGTAPAGPTTFNFVGPTVLTTCNVIITPGS